MVTDEKNILTHIISVKDSLPKKQKSLCDYMLENHQDMGLLTVKELAQNAMVGTTTVLRLMKKLGYDSFFEMKKDFYNIQTEYSDKFESVQKSFGTKHEKEGYQTLKETWQEGINVLNNSLNPQLIDNFSKAMDLMNHAEKINLLGLRPYKATAIYLELLIEEFHSKTRQLSYDSESMFERILQFKKNEVLLLFSFQPYTQRIIDAAKVAHKQGVPIILITDELFCPVINLAKVVLKIETSKEHYTILPIIALIEAMSTELGKRNSAAAIQNIKKLTDTLKENNIIV